MLFNYVNIINFPKIIACIITSEYDCSAQPTVIFMLLRPEKSPNINPTGLKQTFID